MTPGPGLDLAHAPLGASERAAIERLVAAVGGRLDLEAMWGLLDRVWDELGCGGAPTDPGRLAAYYSHPVWTLNGVFIENDPESMSYRNAIADWAEATQLERVLDFGGGFGTTARLIGGRRPDVEVEIVEPHPGECARALVRGIPNVRFVAAPTGQYDCLLCLDVLEHLEDPLLVLRDLLTHLRPGGHLVVGNCFRPVIKCHVASAFHLDRNFTRIARLLGLRLTADLSPVYPQVFRKSAHPLPWAVVRGAEGASAALERALRGPVVGPLLRSAARVSRRALRPGTRGR